MLRKQVFVKFHALDTTFDGWCGNVGIAIISMAVEIIHSIRIQVSYRQT